MQYLKIRVKKDAIMQVLVANEVMCNIKICLPTIKCIPILLIKVTKYNWIYFSIRHDMNQPFTYTRTHGHIRHNTIQKGWQALIIRQTQQHEANHSKCCVTTHNECNAQKYKMHKLLQQNQCKLVWHTRKIWPMLTSLTMIMMPVQTPKHMP
jgi:hypothetical protein